MVREQVDSVDALMAHYVAGTLPEPVRVLVEAHLEMKADSRHFVADLETLAGASLENEGAASIADRAGRLETIFRSSPPPSHAASALQRPADAILPASLYRLIGCEADGVPWKTRLPGFREYHIGDMDGCEVSLMWIRPGRALPAHTHKGVELVLVVDGAFNDIRGYFGRGDISVADETVDHRPIAARDRPCIAFSVTDAPIRLTGSLTQLIGDLIG